MNNEDEATQKVMVHEMEDLGQDRSKNQKGKPQRIIFN